MKYIQINVKIEHILFFLKSVKKDKKHKCQTNYLTHKINQCFAITQIKIKPLSRIRKTVYAKSLLRSSTANKKKKISFLNLSKFQLVLKNNDNK